MARDPKIEVAAVNIRIPDDKRRDYNALIVAIAGLRRGIRVFGDSYVAINYYDANLNIGVISKYTEIDTDGDWFNIDDFDIATPEQISQITIPRNLKPNFSQFYFKLFEKEHILAFEVYSSSRALSTKSVEKYIRSVLESAPIKEEFGLVEADIVKSFDRVDAILSLPDLRELRLIIRRPNPDDVGSDLASIIEERLKEQNGSEYEEKIKSDGVKSLTPNERTKKLASVAAENGQVKAKSIVNGVLTEQSTVDAPLIEVDTYKPDEVETTVFGRLAGRLLEKISSRRSASHV